MALGSIIISIYRLISRKWRPYCWMSNNYDENNPCNLLLGDEDAWCCKECPFHPKNFSKR